MPYFKQVTRVADGSLTEKFRLISGKFIADWITGKYKEVDEYNAAVPVYDILRVQYNAYVREWNEKYAEIEADFGIRDVLTWYFKSGLFSIQEMMKPPVPQVPSAYDGPTMYTSGTTLNFL